MTLSVAAVQQLYVLCFNRPADASGLAFWTSIDGLTLDALARTFVASKEFSDSYVGMSATGVVTRLYQHMFNRSPEPDGLAFWSAPLERGALGVTDILLSMAAAAQDAKGTDGAVLANKVSVATRFTASLDTPVEIQQYDGDLAAPGVKALLDSLTADATSLAGALARVDATIQSLFPPVDPGPPPTPTTPQTLALTAGPDSLVGGTADDTFTGDRSTWQASDVIDGGAGIDLLSLEADGDVALNGSHLVSIERLRLKAVANTVVALDQADTLTSVENEDSSAHVTFGAPGVALNALTQVGIKGGTGNTTVLYTAAAMAGIADEIHVALDDTGLAAPGALRYLTIHSDTASSNQLESMRLSVTGTNTLLLATDSAQATLGTLTIEGSGSLTLYFMSPSNDRTTAYLTTIDASAATGDLIINATWGPTGGAARTITLGAGNDTYHGSAGVDIIDVGAGDNVVTLSPVGSVATGAGDRVTLGPGSDTVVFATVNAAGDGDTVGYDTFANVAQFRMGSPGATDRLSFSAFDSAFQIGMQFGLAKGATVAGLTAGDAIVTQVIAAGESVAMAADVTFFKTTGAVDGTGRNIQDFFVNAMTGTIHTVPTFANYLISAYDSGARKMVIAAFNSGDDGVVGINDMDYANLAVVGTVDMSYGDYMSFGAGQLAPAA